MKKLGVLALVASCLTAHNLSAQPIEDPNISLASSSVRVATSYAVTATTFLPYCVDLMWKYPTGGRVGWLTASVANPDPSQAKARVFLLRGSGTVFSPGFGEICTRLRRSGLWAEDLGPAGAGWVCRHLIAEHAAGRLQCPIVLVGHSRGARHAVEVARELEKAGVKVDLLVCLDVTRPAPVPGNVRQALNVYKSQHRLYPADALQAAAGSMAHMYWVYGGYVVLGIVALGLISPVLCS
jgi:hypothetical protein